MALSLRKAAGDRKVDIPTASQGDIAFLIMIFFMTTTVFAKEKGLKIVLPEKGEPIKIKSENILQVAVSPTGQVLIGDAVVTIPEVRPEIESRLAQNSSLAIALRVSRKAPYHVMVDVFDQLKLARAERISLMPVIEEEAGTPP
jgi:biopolymer transport protein ExbD